jgi:hypothetical protein
LFAPDRLLTLFHHNFPISEHLGPAFFERGAQAFFLLGVCFPEPLAPLDPGALGGGVFLTLAFLAFLPGQGRLFPGRDLAGLGGAVFEFVDGRPGGVA